jgi:hypothetical protein
MNWKVVGEFLGGLIVGVLCAAVFAWFMFDRHLDLFGYAQVTHPEQRDGAILLESLLFVVGGTVLAFLMRKTKLHYFAAGFWLVFLGVSLLPIITASRYFVKSNYYQPFDKTVWLKEHPLKMSREIEKSRMVNGMTRREVEQLLGKGESVNWANDGAEFVYDAGDWYDAFLYIKYKNKKAVLVQVGCHCD